jgi:TRAP-type C4-dicarboxylate transport system substrate-binding protein
MSLLSRFVPHLAVPGLALCLVLGASPALAQTITWEMPNEYPQSSIHGEGDIFFGDLVAKKTKGHVTVVHRFERTSGLTSKDMFEAVASGKVPMADIYGGALGDIEPIFLLPSLPFVAVSTDQARALFETAQADYEQALARHNQRLLYSSPWPPTGVWAKQPVASLEALKGLRIRTYDANGTITFKALGADPIALPFTEAVPKLGTGELQAVLSSGDGGAGAELWTYLDHFTAINYAMPLSLVTMNLDVWNKLDGRTKRAVRDAANAAEARQWTAIRKRVEENYLRMQANHVQVTAAVPPPFTRALKEAGHTAIEAWLARIGTEGRVLLADYDRRTH